MQYHEDHYLDFVEELYRKYPGHWFAILITKEGAATGITEGRVLAHGRNSGVVGKIAYDYHLEHPEAVIKAFTTAMAAPYPGLA